MAWLLREERAVCRSPCPRTESPDPPPMRDRTGWCRWLLEARCREHGLHRVRRLQVRSPIWATAHCRQAISSRREQGELSLVHSGSGEAKCRQQVFWLQIWIFIQNLLMGHALRKQADHGRDRYSETAHTRHTSHLIGAHRNSAECHLSCRPAWFGTRCSPPRPASFTAHGYGLRTSTEETSIADEAVPVPADRRPVSPVLPLRSSDTTFVSTSHPLKSLPRAPALQWARDRTAADSAASAKGGRAARGRRQEH